MKANFVFTSLFLMLVMLVLSSGVFAQEQNNSDYTNNSLKSFELMDKFSQDSNLPPSGEHYAASIFGGLLTGGTLGAAGGLIGYSSQTKEKSLNIIYITAGSIGLLGGITGAAIAAIERKRLNPYAIGKPLFIASWGGMLGGAALGAIFSLIPYSKNQNTDVILKGTGIGAVTGFGIGLVSYLIAPVIQKKIMSKRKKVSVAFFSGFTKKEGYYRLSISRNF